MFLIPRASVLVLLRQSRWHFILSHLGAGPGAPPPLSPLRRSARPAASRAAATCRAQLVALRLTPGPVPFPSPLSPLALRPSPSPQRARARATRSNRARAALVHSQRQHLSRLTELSSRSSTERAAPPRLLRSSARTRLLRIHPPAHLPSDSRRHIGVARELPLRLPRQAGGRYLEVAQQHLLLVPAKLGRRLYLAVEAGKAIARLRCAPRALWPAAP